MELGTTHMRSDDGQQLGDDMLKVNFDAIGNTVFGVRAAGEVHSLAAIMGGRPRAGGASASADSWQPAPLPLQDVPLSAPASAPDTSIPGLSFWNLSTGPPPQTMTQPEASAPALAAKGRSKAKAKVKVEKPSKTGICTVSGLTGFSGSGFSA